MKLIKAYIRHRKIKDVYNALTNEGYCCMTFVECEGTGNYTDSEREHISVKYEFAEAYKVVKLEILIPDKQTENVIKIIRKNGRTGYHGDGIIIVSEAEEVYKIRTDEKGIHVV